MRLTRRSAMVGLAVALVDAGAGPGRAQPVRVPRIGYLRLVEVRVYDDAFRRGLGALGYVDGRNIRIEYRFSGGSAERLTQQAAELAALDLELIVAGSTQSIEAVRKATRTVPIVFPVTFDPVGSGFVESLARPGGNLTGLSPLNPELAGKRVELLRELLPKVARVGVLRNPTNSGSSFALKGTMAAAQRVGIRIQALEARRPEEFEDAFRAAVRDRAEALVVLSDTLFFTQQARIVELANRHRLPPMFDTRGFVEQGGLISYGADLEELFFRSAAYVDKILKGAKPSELPVEQATKFELWVNQRAARLLGVTIPPAILVRADRVID